MSGIAAILENITLDNLLHCDVPVPKPPTDFIWEAIDIRLKDKNINSIDDIIIMSQNGDIFYKKPQRKSWILKIFMEFNNLLGHSNKDTFF